MSGGRSRVGIEFQGRTMRYAEVDPGEAGGPPRLLRLGACDFDFDAEEAFFDVAGLSHVETVATAAAEIFEGTRAGTLYVVVHPWRSTSFFSPLPEGMSPAARYEQLRQEAALLADASVARPIRIRATPVRTEALPGGRQAHWHHVLRLPENVHARAEHIAGRLGERVRAEFADAAGAAATLAGHLLARDDVAEAPLALTLGLYGGYAEYGLARGEAWRHFGHHAETGTLADGAYFAVALLGRLGVEPPEVEHLLVYGDGAASGLAELEALLGLAAEPLDPLPLFRPASGPADARALAAYAPCVGALLR